MTRPLAVAVLLTSSLALAQADVGAAGARIRDVKMTANLVLYVADGGTDQANNCLSQANPCAQPQHAIDQVPKQYGYNALISLGAGTYNGFTIEGFNFAGSANNPGGPTPDAGNSPWIMVQGPLVNVADAGGGQLSGTVASATSGGSPGGGAPATWGTITVPVPGWATNGLVGYQMCIVANADGGIGPDVGECRQIDSNDSGVATIVGSWTVTPTSSSSWQLKDVSAFITPTVSPEQSPFTNNPDFVAPDMTAVLVKGNNGQGVTTWPIILSQLGVNALSTTNSHFLRESGSTNSVAVLNSRWVNTTSHSAYAFVLDNGAHLWMQSDYVDCHSSTSFCRQLYYGFEDPNTSVPELAAQDIFVVEQFNKWRGSNETTCVSGSNRGHTGYGGRLALIQNSFSGISRFFSVGGPIWLSSVGNHSLASPATNCTISYLTTAASDYGLPGYAEIDGDVWNGNSGAAERYLDLLSPMTIAFDLDNTSILNTQNPYYFRSRDSYVGIVQEGSLSILPQPSGTINNDIVFEIKSGNQLIPSASTIPTTGPNRCITETSNNNKICNQ